MKNYAIVPFWEPKKDQLTHPALYFVKDNMLSVKEVTVVGAQITWSQRDIGLVFTLREMAKECRNDILTLQPELKKKVLLKEFVIGACEHDDVTNLQMVMRVQNHWPAAFPELDD